MGGEFLRTYIVTPVPDTYREEAKSLTRDVRRISDQFRTVPPDHATLLSAGLTPGYGVSRTEERVRRVMERVSGASVEAGGFRLIPFRLVGDSYWADICLDIQPRGTMVDFHRLLKEELGVRRAQRYMPHVSVAYVKTSNGAAAVEAHRGVLERRLAEVSWTISLDQIWLWFRSGTGKVKSAERKLQALPLRG